jgi:hypothetical protein
VCSVAIGMVDSGAAVGTKFVGDLAEVRIPKTAMGVENATTARYQRIVLPPPGRSCAPVDLALIVMVRLTDTIVNSQRRGNKRAGAFPRVARPTRLNVPPAADGLAGQDTNDTRST